MRALLAAQPPALADTAQVIASKTRTGAPKKLSKQVAFGRRALAMQSCSTDHISDLLTFAPA